MSGQTSDKSSDETSGQTSDKISGETSGETSGIMGPAAGANAPASVPADHGLGSLGLLMQLGGTLGMAAAAAVAIPAAIYGERTSSVVFFFALLYGVRAAFHRVAGSAVLYGTGGHPRRSVVTYLCVAACHSVVTLLLLRRYVDDALLLRIAGLLLAWPAVLLACVSLPRPGRLLARAVPPAEDHGFEGASVLMTVLGSAGLACAALILAVLVEIPALPGLLGVAAGGDEGLVRLLVLAACGLCVLRAVVHLRAGVRGATGAGFEAHQARAARYGAVGGATAAGVALLLAGAIAVSTGNLALVLIVGICAREILGAWPAILRRLHAERGFDVYLAGDRAPAFRRAPDAGLMALGWLLVALGTPALAQCLVAVLAGDRAAWPVEPGMLSLGDGWRTLLMAGLQVWAGVALLGASARARRIVAVYGMVAVGLALGSATFALADAFSLGMAGAHDGAQALDGVAILARLAGAGVELAVPCAALWLVERTALPRAVALTRGR
jgi:hypothetical protein